jgi:hypothetical protein
MMGLIVSKRGWVALCAAWLAAQGCDRPEPAYEILDTCAPGDTQTCDRSGCQGTQACLQDGSGFGSCECAESGGSGSTTSSGSGGSAGKGGSGGTGGLHPLITGGATNVGSGAQGGSGTGGTAGSGGESGGDGVHVECDVVAQTGCEAGETCALSPPINYCTPAGNGVEGALCAAEQECAPGLICHFGNCLSACETDADCNGGTVCGFELSFDGLVFGACVHDCNQLAQDCAGSDEGCYFGGCLTMQALSLGQGDQCEWSNECAAGYDCLLDGDQNGFGDCGAYCDALGGVGGVSGETPSCASGTQCVALADYYPGFAAEVGLCAPQ